MIKLSLKKGLWFVHLPGEQRRHHFAFFGVGQTSVLLTGHFRLVRVEKTIFRHNLDSFCWLVTDVGSNKAIDSSQTASCSCDYWHVETH